MFSVKVRQSLEYICHFRFQGDGRKTAVGLFSLRTQFNLKFEFGWLLAI